jgi:hypothetical protein
MSGSNDVMITVITILFSDDHTNDHDTATSDSVAVIDAMDGVAVSVLIRMILP